MTDTTDTEPIEPINESDAAAIIAAAEENASRQNNIVVISDGESARAVAVLKPGERIESIKEHLDEYLLKPERNKGVSTMDDLPSLLDECKRFNTPALTVYVHAKDPKLNPTVRAVFNDATLDTTAFGDHGSQYAPDPSNAIKKWLAADQLQTQENFAELIEDRVSDLRLVDKSDKATAAMKSLVAVAEGLNLAIGTPAQLVEVSRGLHVNVGQSIKGKPNLHNGAVQFAFEESVTPTVTVPGAVIIDVPFFQGSEPVLMLAKLRYKLVNGQIMWRVVIHDLDRVYDAAVQRMCALIADAGFRVVRGQPS